MFAVALVHAAFPVMWLRLLSVDGPTPSDWSYLQLVGQTFVQGEWSQLYASGDAALREGWLWLYPPYALYLVAPLALLPPFAAYGLLAGLGGCALGGALLLLARLAPPGEGAAAWTVAIAFSAPAYTNLVAGQSAALLTLCVVVGATLLTRGRERLGWTTLGLLALKPNWGLFVGVYALTRGAWRGAAILVGVALTLCLSSLPLGLDLWGDFLRVSTENHALFAGYDAYRLITLKGFLGAVLGDGALAVALWLVLGAGLLVAAAIVWRAAGTPLEHLSAAILLAVAANPYASFYDALVLAVPATAWLDQRDRWRPGAWWSVGAVAAAMWVWEHLAHSWLPMLESYGRDWALPFSLVGPGAAVWLVVWAHEVRSRSAVLDELRPGARDELASEPPSLG